MCGSLSISQFYTVGQRRINRHNYRVKHIHTVHNSTRPKGDDVHTAKGPGLFQLGLVNPVAVRKHAF